MKYIDAVLSGLGWVICGVFWVAVLAALVWGGFSVGLIPALLISLVVVLLLRLT